MVGARKPLYHAEVVAHRQEYESSYHTSCLLLLQSHNNPVLLSTAALSCGLRKNVPICVIARWTYASAKFAAMIGWKSDRSELLLDRHVGSVGGEGRGDKGKGGAASGILESSPMGAVRCVRCKRLDGAQSARVTEELCR